MTAPQKPPLKPPSEEFTEAFSARVGSITGTCEFCNRTYFTGQTGVGYDEGELEGLRQKAKEQPEKYIEWDGGPSFVEVDGVKWVDGCDCNAPRRHEDWIWANRWAIADYLKARCAKTLKSAKEIYEATEDIPRLIDLSTKHVARKVEDVGDPGVDAD